MALEESTVLEWLAAVPDPEIPVLSILDLGIVRDVDVSGEGVAITLTPTYSGCPATEVIESSVVRKMQQHGVDDVRIKRSLSPPWTTQWISDDGRQKMRRYGIAPPSPRQPIACPQCDSADTTQISEFGSTACKAAWRCNTCLEPFEYFKCL